MERYEARFDREGRITGLNDALAKALGRGTAEVIGADYFETVFTDDDRPGVRCLFARLFRDYLPQTSENRLRTAKGRGPLVEWHARAEESPEGIVESFISVGRPAGEWNIVKKKGKSPDLRAGRGGI
ncbi:MAG: PAS domain-containing protein [Deltaproteobacteria bacterium]